MEKFYLMQTFSKVQIFAEVSKISENFEKWKENQMWGAPALRVIRAGTRLTVHRSLPLLFELYQAMSSRR